jgi:hypothetical protein
MLRRMTWCDVPVRSVLRDAVLRFASTPESILKGVAGEQSAQ